MATNTDFPSFSLNLPGVHETRKLEQEAQDKRAARFSSPVSRAFYDLGTVFGKIADKGEPGSVAMIKAQINDRAKQEYGATIAAGLDDPDADPVAVQLDAVRAAADNLRAAGSHEEASKLDTQLAQMTITRQIRDAELSKIKATTTKTEAETEVVGQGSPSESERLIARRERLIEQRDSLSSDANKAAVNRQISAVDKRLDKLSTITGRTEQDVGGAITPTPAMVTQLQKDISLAQPGIDVLNNLVTNYDPSLDLGDFRTKARYEALSLASKAGLASPEDQQFVAAANSQQQRIQTSYNEEVKRLSGSAVSAHEQVRVDKQQIVEKDAPAVKQAKMNAAFVYQKAAQRRRQRALAGGGDVAVMAEPIEEFMEPHELKAWNWDSGKARPSSGKAVESMNSAERADEARRLLGL